MNAIPRVAITPLPGGLLVACLACGWERHYPLQSAAHRAAREHEKTCKPGRAKR